MKNLIFIIISVLFISCSASKNPSVEIFQSVDAKYATLIDTAKVKGYCAMCGEDLVKYYKTNHIAYKGDKRYQYCSIHCMVGHLKDTHKTKNPLVVDVVSLKFINVKNAYYVVDSDKPATGSEVSKYAYYGCSEAWCK